MYYSIFIAKYPIGVFCNEHKVYIFYLIMSFVSDSAYPILFLPRFALQYSYVL